MKHLNLSIICVFLVTVIFSGCQAPTPARPEPYPNSTLTLEAIQVNSIDAVLKLTLTNLDSLTGDTLPIILSRNGHAVQAFNFIPPDTTLWDEGLEPNRDYAYTAYRQSVYNTALIDSSAPLTLTTLDTTSHDFTWTIDTLGSYGSYFNDVAIIDENNIWAVGEIYVPDPDSSWNGTGYESFNAARWDGEQWNLKQIPFIGSCSAVTYPMIKAIWAFSENNIFLTNGGALAIFDGTNTRLECGINQLLDGAVNAIWGSSPEDVYFVGGHGRIIHYDGSGFIRLESGTDVDLLDIWGNSDGSEVWTCGWDYNTNEGVLLRKRGTQWQTLWHSTERYPWVPYDKDSGELLGTLWTDGNREFLDRKSTRLNSSHTDISRMPSSA